MTTINLMGLRSCEIRVFAWVAASSFSLFFFFLFLLMGPSIGIIREKYTAMRQKRYIGTLRSLTTLQPPASSGIDGLELSSMARPGCFRRVGRVLLFDHIRFASIASLLAYDPAFHVVSQIYTTRQPPPDISQIHRRRDIRSTYSPFILNRLNLKNQFLSDIRDLYNIFM